MESSSKVVFGCHWVLIHIYGYTHKCPVMRSKIYFKTYLLSGEFNLHFLPVEVKLQVADEWHVIPDNSVSTCSVSGGSGDI